MILKTEFVLELSFRLHNQRQSDLILILHARQIMEFSDAIFKKVSQKERASILGKVAFFALIYCI